MREENDRHILLHLPLHKEAVTVASILMRRLVEKRVAASLPQVIY
jgi:hypothetical protein